MGEKENSSNGGDDQKSLTTEAPKSPWKNSSILLSAPAVVDPDSWPPLSDVQNSTKKLNSLVAKNGLLQGLGANQKIDGRSRTKSSDKPMPMRQSRAGPKHRPGGVPLFPVPLPYHQPGISPVQTIVPVPHIPVPGYVFHPPHGPPCHTETNLVKPFLANPSQASVPPVNGRFQTPSKTDPNACDASNLSKRPNVQNHVGHLSPGPRHFTRPPLRGPAPGFVGGTRIPSHPGAILYYPAPPPGSFRVPYPPIFVPHLLGSGGPMLPPSDFVLRTNIAKQIEYYFSDGNLEGDYYLRSLMDYEGWVAVSQIADFKRLKRMTTDVSLILEASKASSAIEVLGERIRRRDDWSKWVPSSACQTSKKTAKDVAGVALTDVKSQSENNEQGAKDSSPLLPLSNRNYQYQSTADDAKNVRQNMLDDGCSLSSAVNQTSSSVTNLESKLEVTNCDGPESHQERETSPKQSDGHEVKMKHPRNHSGGKGGLTSSLSKLYPDARSNDFENNFEFAEELESERKNGMESGYDYDERIDDEEDDDIVSGQNVNKLVIVTRIDELSGTSPGESNPVSSEHASAINELLDIYEQELKSKQSRHKNDKPCNDAKDERSKSPAVASAVSEAKASKHSSAVSTYEGP